LAATILTFAAAAAAQASSTTATLTALQQCLLKTCPNNVNDVNCQAACLGLPNPNASMIADTAACYAKCPASDQQAQIDCKNKCDQIYNPSGSVITGHETPAGFSAASTSSAPSSKPASAASSTPAATSGSSKPPSSSSSAAPHTGSELPNLTDSNESSNSEKTSNTKTSSAATLKAAFSAAVIVAAAALF
ncbi:hypothetical protein H4R26_005404, partial [Coemansia thaxteri]